MKKNQVIRLQLRKTVIIKLTNSKLNKEGFVKYSNNDFGTNIIGDPDDQLTCKTNDGKC